MDLANRLTLRSAPKAALGQREASNGVQGNAGGGDGRLSPTAGLTATSPVSNGLPSCSHQLRFAAGRAYWPSGPDRGNPGRVPGSPGASSTVESRAWSNERKTDRDGLRPVGSPVPTGTPAGRPLLELEERCQQAEPLHQS